MCPTFALQGYKVYYTTRKAYPLSARQVKRTPNQKIRLEDLLPNATYIVSISPYNAAGDGPMSEDHYSLILPGGKSLTHFLVAKISYHLIYTLVHQITCVL